MPDKRAYRRSGVLELSSHRCTKSNGLIRLKLFVSEARESTSYGGGRNDLLIRQSAPPNGSNRSIEPLRQLAETILPSPVSLCDRFTGFRAEDRSRSSSDTFAFRANHS